MEVTPASVLGDGGKEMRQIKKWGYQPLLSDSCVLRALLSLLPGSYSQLQLHPWFSVCLGITAYSSGTFLLLLQPCDWEHVLPECRAHTIHLPPALLAYLKTVLTLPGARNLGPPSLFSLLISGPPILVWVSLFSVSIEVLSGSYLLVPQASNSPEQGHICLDPGALGVKHSAKCRGNLEQENRTSLRVDHPHAKNGGCQLATSRMRGKVPLAKETSVICTCLQLHNRQISLT
ncbi:hypothetical protein P7K49_008454 [Saguinus oedipus]|uniref:Uncharacterized protein n=1 Tax=Saguinus oedipus TaxID=9490 RepID=A0ABQ9W041_SAGOE|nr:hypothetical protein P7K49_008454 [Saguinus oedipus]